MGRRGSICGGVGGLSVGAQWVYLWGVGGPFCGGVWGPFCGARATQILVVAGKSWLLRPLYCL